jgi:hypothetical protein
VTRRELDEPYAAARAIERLCIYARFPQGIPPLLDRSTLESAHVQPHWPGR